MTDTVHTTVLSERDWKEFLSMLENSDDKPNEALQEAIDKHNQLITNTQ